MFVQQSRNRSGSVSVQIVRKEHGRNRVLRTVGSGRNDAELGVLLQEAAYLMRRMQGQGLLFTAQEDQRVEAFMATLGNEQVRVIGPELILGRVFDAVGFGAVPEILFRHLVIARLSEPGSKLRTVDHMQRYMGVSTSADSIYRFMDRLDAGLKTQVEQIAFAHTRRVLGGKVSIVFYDMTTLHFEAEQEDDLRRMGYSKAGKHQNPQIFLGLLVGLGGLVIGYDMFEGNIFEGHTLIPFLKAIEQRFAVKKPIVVADAGLLTNDNINALEDQRYTYIIGARLRNQSDAIKARIHGRTWTDGLAQVVHVKGGRRLVVAYSDKRASKDAHARRRGLERLEKNLRAGRLTKSSINNKGYNRYLVMEGQVDVRIDYERYAADQRWDGLKGYVTNTRLAPNRIIEHYGQLWQIEKAFRISKTDLRIRPVFHRLRRRIGSHICIAFAAYTIYKELERVLKKENAPYSAARAIELTHNMYCIDIRLPSNGEPRSVVLGMDQEQTILHQVVLKNF
jgi:transposase